MSRNGPNQWSVSAGRLYESCPQAFYLKYVKNVRPPKTEIPLHWRLGTVCHAGLEAAYKLRKATKGFGPMFTDDIWEAAKAGIQISWLEEQMPEPELSDGMWDRVHAMVEKTLRDQSESWEDIADVEKKLFIRCGMNVIGFADLLLNRMPGLYRVRDWKSRSTKTHPFVLSKDFQGRLYAGMVYRLFPDADEVEFSHYYPPIAEEVVVPITREQGEEAISRLRAVRDMAHHDTVWEPAKGTQCGSCAFKPYCPAWAQSDEERILAEMTKGI